MSKSWFKVLNLAGEPGSKDSPRRADISIIGQIGDGWWTGQGITAGPFMRAIDALGDLDEINVDINSPGGDVMDGLTIANYLRNHAATVNMRVVGQAASIASVILMAGDKRTMGLGATAFVHDPISGVIGDADEMRKMADELDKIRDGIVEVYQSRVDLSREDLITLMKDDTRMTADEAIAWGFATDKDSNIKAAACADMAPILAKAKEQAIAHAARVTEADNVRIERDQFKVQVTDLQAQIDALRRGPDAADPSAVISLCAEHGVANLAAGWVQAKAPMADVQARVDRAKAIKDMAVAAGIDPAPYLAKLDDPTEMLRVAIVTAKAAADQNIDNTLNPGGDGGGKTGKGTAEIYRHRNQTKLLKRI